MKRRQWLAADRLAGTTWGDRTDGQAEPLPVPAVSRPEGGGPPGKLSGAGGRWSGETGWPGG